MADIFAIVALIANTLVVVFLIVAAVYFYNVSNLSIPSQGQSLFMVWTAVILAVIAFFLGIYAIYRIFTYKPTVVLTNVTPKPIPQQPIPQQQYIQQQYIQPQQPKVVQQLLSDRPIIAKSMDMNSSLSISNIPTSNAKIVARQQISSPQPSLSNDIPAINSLPPINSLPNTPISSSPNTPISSSPSPSLSSVSPSPSLSSVSQSLQASTPKTNVATPIGNAALQTSLINLSNMM